MANYKEKIINIQTGEETFREYTATEKAEFEKESAEIAKRVATQIAETEAKAAARASALAKLAALGLSADEIAAL